MRLNFGRALAIALLGLLAFLYTRKSPPTRKTLPKTPVTLPKVAAKDTAHGTKVAAKDTAKDTDKAAKDTAKGTDDVAHKTGHGIKKVGKGVGHGVKKGATKTADAVK